MWSLKRDGQGSENERAYYLTVGEHLVGRKDCQIQIPKDQSVSRKHAWITVSQSGSAAAQVSLKDVSKFGSLVNDVKCQNSVVVILNHNDKVTFGTQNCSYRLEHEPLVVFASCLESAKKKNLKSQLSKLGGYMVNEWQKGCSHLVMEALSFTVKVIYALATCCPIVTPSFFDDLVKAIDSKSELPSPEKYCPAIKEDQIDPKVVSFHPNDARKSIFTGKLFLFLEKKQYKRLEQAVVLAGGRVLLKETGAVSGCDDEILTDQNTLVMSMDSNLANSEANEMWLGHVGDVLKSVNRRPIAETEVGLAILHVSLDEYCNPSLHHVPKIVKQIVSKSISTMEEMSQRMSESQNVSINQIHEKKPFSLRHDDPKQTTTFTTPQDTIKKRSRNGSDELQPLVFETPESCATESKRRKISPCNITHISQTPEPEFKTPSVQKKDITRNEKPSISKTDITHVSQSENCHESQGIGLKRKASSPENYISHVSQRQDSHHEEKPKSSLTRRLGHSNVDVTHISQSQPSQHEERPPKVKTDGKYSHEITHISQSQNSQAQKSETLLSDNERPKRNTSDDEVTVVPESQTSPATVIVKETPSPKISFLSKRRKISSSDITHISDTERSMVAEPPRGSNNVSPPITSFSDDHTTFQPTELKDSARENDSITDTVDSRKDEEKASEKQELDEINTDEEEQERISRIQDLSSIKSILVSPPGSGWMSKRSFSMKKEKSEMNRSGNRTDIDGGIEELEGSNSGSCSQGGNTVGESQGLSSKQEQHTISGEVVVKKEQNSEIPNDLLCVEHVELVVARSVLPKSQQSQKKFSSKLKNMKKFRKQNYAGGDDGLPRIIGGSDLVVFASNNGNIEDWMVDVEAMRQQEEEDREADNLFHYEPISKRRNRR